MYTDINSEDRLVQKTFADYLRERHAWESVYAWNDETFGPEGTLGRTSEREVVLVRYLRQAITRLNPELPASAVDEAVAAVTAVDFSRSTIQHNREAYRYIRDGVPVSYRDAQNQLVRVRARLIDFRNAADPERNHFLVVRELKIQGQRTRPATPKRRRTAFTNTSGNGVLPASRLKRWLCDPRPNPSRKRAGMRKTGGLTPAARLSVCNCGVHAGARGGRASPWRR